MYDGELRGVWEERSREERPLCVRLVAMVMRVVVSVAMAVVVMGMVVVMMVTMIVMFVVVVVMLCVRCRRLGEEGSHGPCWCLGVLPLASNFDGRERRLAPGDCGTGVGGIGRAPTVGVAVGSRVVMVMVVFVAVDVAVFVMVVLVFGICVQTPTTGYGGLP